jgi:iron(III) transport system ATP-binding protein
MEQSPEGGTSRPYLRITNLTKRFGDATVLDDVSLEVHEGEFICFLGPSGCGKTTLLRVIAGLETQTSGRIKQGERDISMLPPGQRDFGIVFQSYALFPNLTVAQNVGYGLSARAMGRAAFTARIDELLKLVDLEEKGPKYPPQLSGGQQQRVALARALATSPGLLLLDEPLSALDAKVRLRLRHEIKQLQRRLGVTTILVTHDQEEALTIADRIVVLNEGVIQQVGSPLDIYRHPANSFVAAFVGTMNFLPAIAVRDGRVRLAGVELAVGTWPPGLREGVPVTVCVRPEDIVVGDASGATRNSIPVRVVDLEFLGSFYRAKLQAGGADDTTLYADFSTHLVRDANVQVGLAMAVALREEGLHVLDRP